MPTNNLNLLDWVYSETISDPSQASKRIRFFIRALYFLTVISGFVALYIPRDYYKIFLDFASYNTDSWGKIGEWALWLKVLAGFLLFVTLRLYIRYKKLSAQPINSLKFYLWLAIMALITIDSIIYIPVFKGLLFWLFYGLITHYPASVKDFLLALNGHWFSWFSFILVGLVSLFGEKVLPKQIE